MGRRGVAEKATGYTLYNLLPPFTTFFTIFLCSYDCVHRMWKRVSHKLLRDSTSDGGWKNVHRHNKRRSRCTHIATASCHCETSCREKGTTQLSVCTQKKSNTQMPYRWMPWLLLKSGDDITPQTRTRKHTLYHMQQGISDYIDVAQTRQRDT
jgi:hypothetical protein